MAYFEKRPSGWRAQIRKKGYPSISATFPTRAEAERWAAEIEGDMSRARFVDTREAQQTTLGDALKRYQREISDQKKGAAQEAGRIARWLEHPLARRPLGAIRSSDLAEYRDKSLKSLSPSTVRLNLAIISHLYTIAIKEWGIEGLTNPCRSLRMPSTTNNARERRPAIAELDRLYKAAGDEHPEMPVIIELAIETAMRRSELMSLRRSQIRGKVAYLEDTKNGERRNVPLSARARTLLAALPARIDGKVFSLRPDTVSNYFARACAKAGIEDLRLHDLRHEATSRLFERGFNMMEVASITGHKTMAMLKRYSHLSPDALADRM